MSEVFQPGPDGPGIASRLWDYLSSLMPGANRWQARLNESSLPEHVRLLIRDIVQGTRLLSFEQAEIATDLIHHFLDGHESGQSYEELVRDFGTTEVAVSLFRSSKLRSRPVSVKAFRGSAAVFGGGIVSYLLLQIFFHAAKPNPTIDYNAQLNETLTSMPDDQKAWPLYRDVWAKHGLVENGKIYEEIWFEEKDHGHPEVEWTNHETSRRLIRPTDPGWDKAAAKLDSLKELLDVLRKGSKLPHIGVAVHTDLAKYSDEDLAVMAPGRTREKIENADRSAFSEFGLEIEISEEADRLLAESTFAILLPHIQQLRRAARVLHVDIRYAMQQRDNSRAIANVKAMFGLGRQAGNNPFLVCSLVGSAIRSIGMNTIKELVAEHLEQLTDEDLRALQSAVESIDFHAGYDPSFEKHVAMDFVQRIYSDDGDGDGRMTAVGAEVVYALSKINWISGKSGGLMDNSYVRAIAGPSQLFSAPSRKEMEALIDETYSSLTREIQTTMWEDVSFDDELLKRDSTGFMSSFMMSLTSIKRSREVKIARQDAVLLALAIHRFERENKRWPKDLDELKSKWLDRTPVDRLSGKPLRFVIRDNAPIVYSLGHDGDDDGGDAVDSDAPWLDRDADGDWVLWPTDDS